MVYISINTVLTLSLSYLVLPSLGGQFISNSYIFLYNLYKKDNYSHPFHHHHETTEVVKLCVFCCY